MTRIHAAHIDGCGNIDTGRYDINVGRNRHGSFAEVRDQQGRLVDRIYDGRSKRLPDGTNVAFDSDRCGEEITVTDKRGHTDKFNRACENDDWDRDHVHSGRSQGPNRNDCNDWNRDHVHGGRPHGSNRDDIRGGRPHGSGRDDCTCNDRNTDFDVDERNNTVDTGRYLISASADDDGELKVYDKYTGQWVRAWGDPHFETSDGDEGNFSKTFTLNLDDGTKVTIDTDGKQNGYITRAVITKNGRAAQIDFGKDHKPDTDELRGREARTADRRTPDGLELYTVHGDLDDLSVHRGGEELSGHIDFDRLAYDQQRKYAKYRE